jgi:mRNA-degrading endonuclease toxin of MazEF toxin-antitoxin module
MIMEKRENRELKRGDIYWAKLPKIEDSKIQSGVRPVIITSNQMALNYSPVIQCVPITSQIKKENLPVHVVLENECLFKPSMALVEQEGLIDKNRLLDYAGSLSDSDMLKIDIAIIMQRGININKIKNKLNFA